jgi:hypothetical protein
MILAANRVFVVGAGRTGLALKMAAMRLMHLGLVVHVAGEVTSPAIGRCDLLLVASGSGTPAGAFTPESQQTRRSTPLSDSPRRLLRRNWHCSGADRAFTE